jgi:hypothetical protein
VVAWNSGAPAPAAEKLPPPVTSAPQSSGPTVAGVPPAPAAPTVGMPLSSRYDFPSAASIPPVSIMNAEPPLPPGASNANAAAPPADAPAATAAAAPAPKVPVPPRRPQIPATTPPAPQ